MSPPDRAERAPRRPRAGSLAWSALLGAVAGYALAAAIDLLADPTHQGAWTLGCVAAGALTLPLAVAALVRARVLRGGIGWPAVNLVLDAGPMVACLCAIYPAMWVAAPAADGDLTAAFAWVGVVGWPLIAGCLRVMLSRPPLRPPWWAVTWLFLGVPATVAIMAVRSDRPAAWIAGLGYGAVNLLPVAAWRHHRARRRLPTGDGDAARAGVASVAAAEDAAPDRAEEAPAAGGEDATPPEAPTAAPPYARWPRRAAGFLVDVLAVTVPYGVPAGVGDWIGGRVGDVLNVVGVLLGAGIGLVYNRWRLGGRTGQTWGRRLVGVRLVGERTGEPIGPARAFGRDLAHVVTDCALYYVGWLVPLWDSKRQTLADKMVHTIVIHARAT